MKGDRKRSKGKFKPGNKFGTGRGREEKVKIEYVRPTVEEAELMQVDPVIHNAMTSALEKEQKTETMILRPMHEQPSYKCTKSKIPNILR